MDQSIQWCKKVPGHRDEGRGQRFPRSRRVLRPDLGPCVKNAGDQADDNIFFSLSGDMRRKRKAAARTQKRWEAARGRQPRASCDEKADGGAHDGGGASKGGNQRRDEQREWEASVAKKAGYRSSAWSAAARWQKRSAAVKKPAVFFRLQKPPCVDFSGQKKGFAFSGRSKPVEAFYHRCVIFQGGA